MVCVKSIVARTATILTRPSSSRVIMSLAVRNSSIIRRSPLDNWNVTNFQFEEKPFPTTRLRLPGLSHESYDRDWNPKITSIMHTSSVARIYALHKPLPEMNGESSSANAASDVIDRLVDKQYFMDWPVLTDDLYMFMSSSEFVISRAMYDNSYPKWPLDMKFTLGNIGNCSSAMVNEYYAVNNIGGGSLLSSTSRPPPENLLWTNTYQLVSVDKTTRKPTRLPDWFRDKYKDRGCLDKGLVLRPFDRPAVTYAHPLTVQWTDTDNYKHTNFASYARWATDALHAALLLRSQKFQENTSPDYSPHSPRISDPDGSSRPGDNKKCQAAAESALRYISKEAVARGLHKMQVTYLREVLEGENIDVHVWQEAGGEPELVLFSVVKNGEDVCQMKWWFFPEEEEEEFPV